MAKSHSAACANATFVLSRETNIKNTYYILPTTVWINVDSTFNGMTWIYEVWSRWLWQYQKYDKNIETSNWTWHFTEYNKI